MGHPPRPAEDVPATLWRSPEERRRDRELKKETVLKVAVRMFNERGFHSTSLDEVAARLGVTKPVIYHYFGNKDQVLFHCLRSGVEQLRDAAERARLAEGDGLARLRRFLVDYGEIIMRDFGACIIRSSENELTQESREKFLDLKRQVDQAMRQLVADAAADGSALTGDTRDQAFALAGALNWTARWYDPHGPLSPREVAVRIADTLLDGIRARG